jgi:FKBP-type peptidyl-prolyl cis-trans isomerase SlyD
MRIAGQCVVSIHYTLTSEGVELDSSRGREPLTYLHGAGGIIPGLEGALEGCEAGDDVSVDIEPADGYGEFNEALISQVPRSAFEGIDKVEPGMQFRSTDQQGMTRNITVVKVEDESVVVDANHPLAGRQLHFEVSVESVREPTAEELQQDQGG